MSSFVLLPVVLEGGGGCGCFAVDHVPSSPPLLLLLLLGAPAAAPLAPAPLTICDHADFPAAAAADGGHWDCWMRCGRTGLAVRPLAGSSRGAATRGMAGKSCDASEGVGGRVGVRRERRRHRVLREGLANCNELLSNAERAAVGQGASWGERMWEVVGGGGRQAWDRQAG